MNALKHVVLVSISKKRYQVLGAFKFFFLLASGRQAEDNNVLTSRAVLSLWANVNEKDDTQQVQVRNSLDQLLLTLHVMRKRQIAVAPNILAVKIDRSWETSLARFLILIINNNCPKC